MSNLRFLYKIMLVLLLSLSTAQAQTEGIKSENPNGLTVTAGASAERVRFTAPTSVVQLRLEVYNSSGKKVFDNELRGGNVLDWRVLDAQATPLADDTYLCVVTVKNLAGKISQRIGGLKIEQGTAKLQTSNTLQMNSQQVAAVGPVEAEAWLTVLESETQQTTTVLAHNGQDGQLIRGQGALSFRLGDFYSGKDAEQMRLTAEGNLGLGIAQPQARLDVDGFVRASQGVVFPDGSVQFSASSKTYGPSSLKPGQFQQKSTLGQEHLTPDISGTGTTGKISKWIDGPAGVLGDANLTEVSGAIGVNGTPNTSFRLDVNGSTRIRGSNPGFNLEGLRPAGNIWLFQTVDDDGRFRLFSQDNVNPGQERLTIKLDTGNIGIGLSNPTNGRLHVLSSSAGTPAIYGESATSRGVWGKSVSSRGVYGESDSNTGVFGISNSNIGVYGESAAANTLGLAGVFGRATGTGGTGVSALSTGSGGVGVYGESATGRAIWGKSVSSRGIYGESASNEGVHGISNTGAGVYGESTNASGIGGYFINTAGGTAFKVDGTGTAIFSNTGNVGIGTTNPTTRLHIEGLGGVATTIKSPNERAILALDSTLAGQRRVWTLESGFGGTPNLFAIFDQTGEQAGLTINTAGLVGVKVLQILGGGDFSENFDVGEAKSAGTRSIEVQRGLVVSIDPENPGQLVVSRRAYDRKVAGIISGAGGISPGLVMGQKGSIADGKLPVALSGRVWAYCDATRNPIKPGDLLTTSTTPGHAMKVRNHTKAQGAIIGKAMTGLRNGKGLVFVLVSLQ